MPDAPNPLRRWREEAGLKPRDLAYWLQVTEKTVYNWEHGEEYPAAWKLFCYQAAISKAQEALGVTSPSQRESGWKYGHEPAIDLTDSGHLNSDLAAA